MKPIDFDNADLMIVGCVLIIITLAIVAGVSSDISFTDVSGMMTFFGGIGSALANPEKVSRQVVGLLRKAPKPKPEQRPFSASTLAEVVNGKEAQ
jgi:hypothetical protein